MFSNNFVIKKVARTETLMFDINLVTLVRAQVSKIIVYTPKIQEILLFDYLSFLV